MIKIHMIIHRVLLMIKWRRRFKRTWTRIPKDWNNRQERKCIHKERKVKRECVGQSTSVASACCGSVHRDVLTYVLIQLPHYHVPVPEYTRGKQTTTTVFSCHIHPVWKLDDTCLSTSCTTQQSTNSWYHCCYQ